MVAVPDGIHESLFEGQMDRKQVLLPKTAFLRRIENLPAKLADRSGCAGDDT